MLSLAAARSGWDPALLPLLCRLVKLDGFKLLLLLVLLLLLLLFLDLFFLLGLCKQASLLARCRYRPPFRAAEVMMKVMDWIWNEIPFPSVPLGNNKHNPREDLLETLSCCASFEDRKALARGNGSKHSFSFRVDLSPAHLWTTIHRNTKLSKRERKKTTSTFPFVELDRDEEEMPA